MIPILIEHNDFQHIVNILHVKRKNLIPLRTESLILGLGLKSGIAQFQDAERVAFASDIGRGQTSSSKHFHGEMPHVFEVVKGAMPQLRVNPIHTLNKNMQAKLIRSDLRSFLFLEDYLRKWSNLKLSPRQLFR